MGLVPPHSTPLDPSEVDGLLLSYVGTRRELNEAEAQNIEAGLRWAGTGRPIDELLTTRFVRSLHRALFGEVWSWAGSFRTSSENLGVDWWTIQPAVETLLADAVAWVGATPRWSVDEISVRLHHRLVAIHPFLNGNGRTSRAYADLVVVALGGVPFSWGARDLTDASDVRATYVAALRAADRHDLEPLLAFVRT